MKNTVYSDANKKIHTFGLVVHVPLSARHGSVKLCNPNHISIMHISLFSKFKKYTIKLMKNYEMRSLTQFIVSSSMSHASFFISHKTIILLLNIYIKHNINAKKLLYVPYLIILLTRERSVVHVALL